jgi:type I restriction enzyme R subunit
MVLSRTKSSDGSQCNYKTHEELNRSVNEVLIESDLKAALIALNLEISMRNELADEVIL